MKLFHIRSVVPALLALLCEWCLAQAPVKKDSIHYSHSGGSLVTSSNILYVRDSVPASSSCTKQIKTAKLKAYLYMGNVYSFGSSTFSGDATIQIKSYSSFVGNSTLISTETVKLMVSQNAPEGLWVKDFTVNHSTIKRFEVTVTGYTAPGATFNDSIQLAVFYDEDFGVNVYNSVQIANSAVTIDNPTTFRWTRGNCKDIINYQFQLLRLYNTDASLTTTDTQIKPLVDWNQALTIETGNADTTLQLTLTEGRGYYVWRVRPIGTYYSGGIADSRNWGLWSHTNYPQGYNSTISASNSPYLFFYYQFDDQLNWIYSRTFSEGDPASSKVRMSEKMAYANGLQQVKQNQSHLYSQKQALLSETVYDWSGRAALNTLAAPDSIYDTLGYRSAYMKSGSELYSAKHFDEDNNYRNPNTVSSSRISRYYGNENSDVYVPNAEKYPFSRALYERDGTGRVKEQSGPGRTHRLRTDSIRTTRTFYSGVSDLELIRVFGDEAPDAKSVHKVINVDANDVASVTYVGKEGEIIATCLAIGTDSTGSRMDTLTSQGTAKFTVNDTVWGKAPLGPPYAGIVSSKPVVFTVPTNVVFKYVIHAKEIEYLCNNYCRTCDYKADVLLRSDDTTITLMSHLLPAKSCTTAVKWDTTFTKNLALGSYIIEKRVYADNINSATASSTSGGKTFLQQHVDSLYNLLSARASDSLETIYYYLHQSDMDSLYIYLGVNINVNNPDSVFADSVVNVNVGCDSIAIPISVCPKHTCTGNTPDFEGYFKKRWSGIYSTVFGGNWVDGSGYYKFFPQDTTLKRPKIGFKPGQFNWMIKNMLTSTPSWNGYTCEQLWTCWERVTQNYLALKQAADTIQDYDMDLLREFLNCTGTRYNGYSSSDTSKYRGKAYEYFFYYKGKSVPCDSMMKTKFGSPGGWAQDSIHAVNPINQKWKNYRDCEESIQPPGKPTIANATNLAECGCMNMCEQRYESFKLGLIRMYHNDSIYVEGDVFALQKDTIWGQVYGWGNDSIDWVGDPPDDSHFVSMDEINCAALSLVEHCKEYCQLTIFGDVDSVGTPGQRDSIKMAMTWGFELERGPDCPGGFDDVYPPSGTDTSFIKIWEKHYGGAQNEGLSDIVEVKYDCGGGYLMVGSTESAEYDVSDSLCEGAFGLDWWAIRVNQEGKKLWEVSLGGDLSGEVATSVIETRSGGFLIGGYSDSDISCDKSDTSRGETDYWVVKLNNLGQVEWNRTYGGNEPDFMTSAIETSTGHFLLGGNSASPISGDKTDSLCTDDVRETDFWVVKIDRNGNIIWDKNYGVNGSGSSGVIRETKEGNYIIGASSGGVSCDKSDASHGGADFWIIWTDTSGAIIKDTIYGGSDEEMLNSLEVLPDSGYILGGTSQSGSGTYKTDPNIGSVDYWLVRIDKNGTKIWDRTYGGTSVDVLNEVAPIIRDTTGMGKGEPALTGFIMGGYSFSDSTASGNKKTRNQGDADYWVVRTDKNGNLRWERTFGGTTTDVQTAMNVDHLSYYWIAGHSWSDISGNKTTTSYGGSDYWVIKGKDNCTHDTICFKWVPLDTIPDSLIHVYTPISCDSMGAEIVTNSIQQQLSVYYKQEAEKLKKIYYTTCTVPDSIQDTLSLRYPLGYHHYTLYYYDRAQNLVRTVPPAGVVTGSTSRNTHPAHTLVTKYKYNSLKQLVQQYTPDGDETNFYYDSKGQLRFSQNKKQELTSVPIHQVNPYSYTKYDNLGRIIEVGESTNAGYADESPLMTYMDTLGFPGAGTQKVFTVYTTSAGVNYPGNLQQRYLQNRVSYTYTEDSVKTYFSYDPHGNVEWLIQDIPGLGKNYTRYEYDLISNKVLKVHYNEGAADEFHHRYTYDEDQRIKKAETAWGTGSDISKNTRQQIGWDLDGAYTYYKHGPLKRMEIGEDKIQGLDYVYTINGWLKAINYPSLSRMEDPGKDNNYGSPFCEDAFGMVLGYHSNDFNRTNSKYNPSYARLISSSGTINHLYNGNISNWTLQTDTISGNYSKQMGMKYRYDQLNRIKTEDYNEYSSGWSSPSNTLDNTYTYDGNGKILTLNRKGTSNDRDLLTAHYYTGTNRLEYVDDAASSGSYSTDIDDQSATNYKYTAIGERAKDVEGLIDTITWTVYGKMKALKRNNGDSILFTYDAMNNRVMKRKKLSGGTESIIYYIRDAQGNIMSMYERTTSGGNYQYKQTEVPIYGSDRIGEYKPDLLIKNIPAGGSSCGSCSSCVQEWTLDAQKSNGYYTRNINKKAYELKDHLGNVHVTVSDRKYNSGQGTMLFADDFNNSFDGWTAIGSAVLSTITHMPMTIFANGDGAKKIFSTVNGNSYSVTFYASRETAGSAVMAAYNESTNTLINSVSITHTGPMGYYTLSFTATGSSSSLRFQNTASAGPPRHMSLDNVTVTGPSNGIANQANLLSYTNYYAFGTELTGKSYNPTSYTFGYNGKLKDDDVFNTSGGFYDYGERGFDMRGIPSPFTPDPYQSKYPQLSPYLSAGNSPILFVDNEGEENIIYLYDLRLKSKNISAVDKQKIIDKMYDIAYKANSDFQKKQLPPRVVVIENEKDYTKLSSSSDILQKSDVLATMGNTQQNSVEQSYLESKGYDYVKTENVGPGEASFSNDQDYDSKGAVVKNTEGDRISINLDITPAYAKTFGVDENTLISNVIQHESTHNAGIAHNNEKETFRPTTGIKNIPDLTTSANYFKKQPGLFGKDKPSAILQTLFTRPDGKFTKNPAKDNIFNKKIKYSK